MSANSSIQWTDATWNPVVGCTQVSAGCDHCYAKTLHDMRHRAVREGKRMPPQYAKPFETVQLMPARLSQPLSWRKPRRIFVNSVSDLFHKDVPDAFLDRVFLVMAVAHQHTFQILTKRAGRMRAYLDALSKAPADRLSAAAFEEYGEGADCTIANVINGYSWWKGARPRSVPLNGSVPLWPLPNVWLGVSVENGATQSRIHTLRETTAAVRFVSFEPLLEAVTPDLTGIDWAIIGGESGKGARPFDIEWAYEIIRRCRASGTAPFVKQLGAHVMNAEGVVDVFGLGVRIEHDRVFLRDSHGGDWNEWPSDLRIREFPVCRGSAGGEA